MFRPNPTITKPKLVDNSEERKRKETRHHMKAKYKGGYPKEIKMGEILMPPYFWYTNDESITSDQHQSRLVGENENQKARTSTSTQLSRGPRLFDNRLCILVSVYWRGFKSHCCHHICHAIQGYLIMVCQDSLITRDFKG